MKISFENEVKELALKYETSDVHKLKKIIEEKLKDTLREKEIFIFENKKVKKVDILYLIHIS